MSAGERDEAREALPARAIGRLGSARWKHDAAVTALSFADDGRLVSVGQDERLRVWRAGDGALLAEVVTDAVLCLAVAPAGDAVAASGDTRVQWFDLATLRPLGAWEAAFAPVAALAMAPDGAQGERIAVGAFDGSVAVFSRAGERLVTLVEMGPPALALRWVDGGRALAVAGDDGALRVLAADGSGEIAQAALSDARPLLALADTPGGLIAGGTSPSLFALDAGAAVTRAWPHGAGERASSLAAAPDGSLIAVGGTSVSLVSPASGAPPRVLPLATGGAARVALSPDGGALAAGASSGRISLWDPRRGERLPGSTGPDDELLCVAFSPDGARLAAAGLDGAIYLGDAVGGGMRVLAGHGAGRHVRGLALFADGRLVSGGEDGSVRVWGERDGAERVRAKTAPVRSLAVSPRGVYAFVGGDQGELHRVSLDDGSVRTVQAHRQAVTAVCIAPDGGVITGSRDRALRFWDPETLEERRKVNATATAAALSPDGTRLVTVGFGEPARVWDTANWLERRTLPALSVQSLAFSPDGARLVTAGGDALVRVWDVARRELLDTLEGHTGREVRAVAWSPDGTKIASGGSDLGVLVWDAGLTAR